MNLAQPLSQTPEHSLGQVFWQVVFSLLVACTAGVLLYTLWDHLGLPQQAQPLWGWSPNAPSGLGYFASICLPLATWLPTAAMGLMIRLAQPMRNEASVVVCFRILSLDAATYLLLPGFILLPVLWRELGNGLAALGFAYLALWTTKGVLLAWMAGEILPDAKKEDTVIWLGLLVSVWVLLLIPAMWVMQTTPLGMREAAYLKGALSWLPDWMAKVDARPVGGNLYYGVILAPFTLVGGRIGGILLSTLCGAASLTLISNWLWRSGRLAPVVCAALAVASAPVWSVFWSVGPEALGMLLLALAMWGMKRPGLAPFCGLHLGLLDQAYLPAAALVSAWGLYEIWKAGYARVSWSRWILVLASLAGLAASQIWHTQEAMPPVSFGLELRRLLLVAPVWLFALAGLPVRLRRHPKDALWLLALPVMIYLHSLVAPLLGLSGDAERISLICLPIMSWFMMPSTLALASPWRRLALAGPAALTLGYTWLATFLPHLHPTLQNNEVLLPALGSALGVEIGRNLPLGASTAPNVVWFGLWLAALAWMGWKAWQVEERAENEPWQPSGTLEVYTLVLGLGALTVLLLISGQLF